MLDVQVPKTLMIKNKRLGCLNIIFTLMAVVLVFFNMVILAAYYATTEATTQGLTLWIGGTKADGYESQTTHHCTAQGSASFKWAYDSTQAWDPKGCRKPERGTDHQKAPGRIFVPTYINDSHVASNGNEFADEYLVQNPEYMVLWVMHGYEVQAMGLLGPANMTKDAASTPDSKLQTIVVGPDGKTECKISGKSRWMKEDSTWGIYGPIKDWLACAGVDLDAVGGQSYGSSAIDGEGYPKVRIAGLSLVLHMQYYNVRGLILANKQEFQGEHPGETCLMKVVALENWNSGVTMAYHSPPPNGGGAGGAWRRRYATGVTITATGSGTFGWVSYDSIMKAVVASVVVLSLPGVAMKIVSYNFVGLLSKIYKRVGIEELDIEDRLDGFASRLMAYASAFRVLTDQTAGVVNGMTTYQLDQYMHEVFAKQKKDGTLDDEEIAKMSAYIAMRMENSERKSVSEVTLDQFIESASRNEPLMPKDLAALFDNDRTPGILERCLGNVKTANLHNKILPEPDEEDGEKLRQGGKGEKPQELS